MRVHLLRAVLVSVFSASTAVAGPLVLDELEPNDSTATANVLIGNQGVVRDMVFTAGDSDHVAISATAGGRVYAVTVTGMATPSTDTTLDLLDSTGVSIANDAGDGYFADNAAMLAGIVVPSDGIYHLRVTGAAVVRSYFLYWWIDDSAIAGEVEPNDSAATAQALTAGVTGLLSPVDPDVFTVALNSGDTLLAAISPSGCDPRLAIGRAGLTCALGDIAAGHSQFTAVVVSVASDADLGSMLVLTVALAGGSAGCRCGNGNVDYVSLLACFAVLTLWRTRRMGRKGTPVRA